MWPGQHNRYSKSLQARRFWVRIPTRSRNFPFPVTVHTGSEAKPASSARIPWLFPGVKRKIRPNVAPLRPFTASYGLHFTFTFTFTSKNKKNEGFDFLFIHSSPFPVVSPILSTIFLLIFPSLLLLCPLLPPYRPRHPKPPSYSLPHFLCVNSTNFISRSSGASSSNFGGSCGWTFSLQEERDGVSRGGGDAGWISSIRHQRIPNTVTIRLIEHCHNQTYTPTILGKSKQFAAIFPRTQHRNSTRNFLIKLLRFAKLIHSITNRYKPQLDDRKRFLWRYI